MFKRYIRIASILFAFTLIITLGTSTSSPAASKEPIKIGYIGNMKNPVPMSGKMSVQLIIDQINAKGGILGRSLTLIAEDSKGEVPLGVARYKKLVMSDGVLAVIVAEGSELNFACQETGAELYKEYPHLAFNPTTSHIDLTKKVADQYAKYKFYFRTFIDSMVYISYLIDIGNYMASKTGKKAALIMEDALWEKPFVEGVPGKYKPLKDEYADRGIKVVHIARPGTSETMYLPMLQQIANANPDFIVSPWAYSNDIVFAKQWAQSAAKDIPLFITGASSTMPGYWGMTGGACLGLCSSNYGVRAAITDKTIPFVDELKSKYNTTPGWTTYGAVDSVIFLQAALQKTGNDNVENLIKALEQVEITGISGILKYEPAHTLLMHNLSNPKGYTGPQVQYQLNGEMVVFYPPDVAQRTNAPGKGFIHVKELRKMAGK
jgi:branched-chain amino acid transport system substrate-binding protein